MVNPGKVLKARKSKRTSLHDKHKIERKVREHHRKERRDRKRNPHKYRKKRDPGIPNTWPFKQQLLLEQEQQREAEVAARAEAREARKRERAEQRASAARLQQAGREGAKVRRAAKRLAASFSPLHEVITSANVVLLVLDARDPASCRSLALEQALLECGKLPILLLNKCDLVPRANLNAWLTALRNELPTLPVAAAASEGEAQPTTRAPAGAAITPPPANASPSSTGLETLHELLAAYRQQKGETTSPLTVGVVGFDGVGKRSIIRLVKAQQWSDVTFLNLPARLQPLSTSMGVNDVLLRKCAPESVPQPEMLVGQVLERCDTRTLLRHFKIAAFDDEEAFLRHFTASAAATAAAKADFNVHAAAVAALKHWCTGRMPFFSAAPDAPVKTEAKNLHVLDPASWDLAAKGDDAVTTSAKAVQHVRLTPGAADPIDLSLEDSRWDSKDVDAMDDGMSEEEEEEEEEEEGEGEDEEEGEDEGGEDDDDEEDDEA